MTTLLDLHLAGLLAGLLVFLVGMVLKRLNPPDWGQGARRLLGLVATLIAIVGALGAIGGGMHLVSWHLNVSKIQPRGQLVDVGGYRLHILCEGDARGFAPVIWLSGGRSTGLYMYHLHAKLREVTRSCIYDRSATGWSEVRPGDPLRLRYDAEDLAKLLEASGESSNGPFLLVGHSAGGILSANFAKIYPEHTAGAILLDPSAPLHDFVGAATWCAYGPPRNIRYLLRRSFGIPQLLPDEMRLPASVRELYKDLEPVAEDIQTLQQRPVTSWLELRGASCRDPLGMVFVPNALGDLPLKVIEQPVRTLEAMKADPIIYPWEMSDFEWENWHAISEMTARQYAEMSTRVIFKNTPAGTGHNFPYQDPDFVVAETLDMLEWLRQGAPQTQAPE